MSCCLHLLKSAGRADLRSDRTHVTQPLAFRKSLLIEASIRRSRTIQGKPAHSARDEQGPRHPFGAAARRFQAQNTQGSSRPTTSKLPCWRHATLQINQIERPKVVDSYFSWPPAERPVQAQRQGSPGVRRTPSKKKKCDISIWLAVRHLNLALTKDEQPNQSHRPQASLQPR